VGRKDVLHRLTDAGNAVIVIEHIKESVLLMMKSWK